MNILYITPLPPPLTGQSLTNRILYNELIKYHNVEIINLSKNSLRQEVISFKSIFQLLSLFKKVLIKNKNADVIYFTISQSITGNIKDLIIYLLCYKSLSKMIVHLHGGGIKNIVFDRNKFIYNLNKFFLFRTNAVIVLSKSLTTIFSEFLPRNKIHIVSNFAENYLFLNEKEIENKFTEIKSLKILFLSNLLKGKGYNKLLDAYNELDNKLKDIVQIDFAGGFESDRKKNKFLNKINGLNNINYHGIVQSSIKKDLLSKAHIFCLPTYYYYGEGQPISILEAYASGCVVITTYHGGITDIFKDGINGYKAKKNSAASIKIIIEKIINKNDDLLSLGLYNNKLAIKKYKASYFYSSMLNIFNNFSNDK